MIAVLSSVDEHFQGGVNVHMIAVLSSVDNPS